MIELAFEEGQRSEKHKFIFAFPLSLIFWSLKSGKNLWGWRQEDIFYLYLAYLVVFYLYLTFSTSSDLVSTSTNLVSTSTDYFLAVSCPFVLQPS